MNCHCTVVSLLPDSRWATETHLLEKRPAQSHVLRILEARDQSSCPSYLAGILLSVLHIVKRERSQASEM